jgi:beta-galactosidase
MMVALVSGRERAIMSQSITRRSFVGAAAAFATLPRLAYGDPPAVPASPRQRIDFNLDWLFVREDVPGAEAPGFDDSKWADIATPHSFNDVDSFRTLISHGGGDRGTYKGLAWYRKHFTPPMLPAGGKLFLEFEGMRQAGDIYLNGKAVGLYENGITPYGIDITGSVVPGKANVLAVKVDNRTTYAERATGTTFQWNANDFNPDHGGINRRVFLYVTGPIFQTLPLYYGLETQGVYIHAANHDMVKRTADVTVDSEVSNSSGDRATVELSAVILNPRGQPIASLDGNTVDMVAGEKTVISTSGRFANATFWSPAEPHLYEVVSILKVEGKVVDVVRTTTGFRQAEYRGGVGTGGVYLNGKFLYLKGYAQRSTDEWAGLGIAYPDWIHFFNAQLIRASNANYVRWMHVSPTPVDAEALCRAGIVQVCPAGDKEADTTGRRWEQRVEVMRDTIIYFRNNPSILFWEAGNTVVSVEHLQQMIALRKLWDPEGQRVMGARGNDNAELNTATTPVAEYFGVMIGQDPKTDAVGTGIFRGYSAARRDRAPLIETEDFRDEAARRYWDDDSPPYFGFKKGPNDTYDYTSESFALAGVKRYWDYWINRISNPDPAHSKWSGYASIYFSDSDADGRQDSSEVARVSGKVDAVRLPKEIYFASRVMQNELPDLHILGHWTYPEDRHVKKTIYVISNCESVELWLNGKSAGSNAKPESGCIFAFPDIAFAPGTLRATGSVKGKVAMDQSLTTAGPAAALKLTPILNPAGGLKAGGADAALIDVEVVDAQGRRCPTDDARVDFALSGPAIWRGGYNSGKIDSTNNLYLNTELGINRVAIRTVKAPGRIVLKAVREGLKPAELVLTSKGG